MASESNLGLSYRLNRAFLTAVDHKGGFGEKAENGAVTKTGEISYWRLVNTGA